MCSKGEKEFSIPIPNLQLFTRLIQFFRRALVTSFLLSPPRSEPYSKYRERGVEQLPSQSIRTLPIWLILAQGFTPLIPGLVPSLSGLLPSM